MATVTDKWIINIMMSSCHGNGPLWLIMFVTQQTKEFLLLFSGQNFFALLDRTLYKVSVHPLNAVLWAFTCVFRFTSERAANHLEERREVGFKLIPFQELRTFIKVQIIKSTQRRLKIRRVAPEDNFVRLWEKKYCGVHLLYFWISIENNLR